MKQSKSLDRVYLSRAKTSVKAKTALVHSVSSAVTPPLWKSIIMRKTMCHVKKCINYRDTHLVWVAVHLERV